MPNQNKSEEATINGFFTKIVSLMFVCSVFVSNVDISPAHARMDSGTAAEKTNVAMDAVYLESDILSFIDSVTVSGTTIPGAHVEIQYASGVIYNVTADTAGYFKLSGLPLMSTGDILDIIASSGDLKISEHLQYNR